MAQWPGPPDLWLQAPSLPIPGSPHWLVKGKPGPRNGSLTFGTWAGIWVGVSAHPPAAGLPPTGLSLWVLPRLCPGDMQRPGGSRVAPAALVSTALPSPPSTPLPLGSSLINSRSFSRMWASGSHVVSPPHLYRLLLVGGPRASHEAPSVEEGWWAPSSGPLPGVFGTLPFAAWLCSTRWSLCHHGWRGSWAGPGDESAEPASVGGIAAALHWHSPRPSYVSSFCALGRRWGGGGEELVRTSSHNRCTTSQSGLNHCFGRSVGKLWPVVQIGPVFYKESFIGIQLCSFVYIYTMTTFLILIRWEI